MATIANMYLRVQDYGPLQDTDVIRLLILHPGDFQDPISCELQHVKLSAMPAYEALSYMWGPKEDLMGLEIDGY